MMIGFLFAFYLYPVLHIISYGSYLRLITGFANNKKISNRFIYFTKIKGNDILPLFFLDSSNNGFDDF